MILEIPMAAIPKSREVFEKSFLQGEYGSPVLFKEAAKAWSAMSWSPDALKERLGDVAVKVQTRECLTMQSFGPVHTEYHTIPFSEYIDGLLSNPSGSGYLAQTSLFELAPSLRDDCHFPEFQPTPLLSRMNMWLGPKGTKSKLHYDSDHNLFAQVYGSKLVTMISPVESAMCYPVNRTWFDGYSPVDALQPDLVKYPRFSQATLYQSVVEAGDILFIPRRWWHDILSLSSSISVNLWWISKQQFVEELLHETKYTLTHLFQREGAVERKHSYLHSLKENVAHFRFTI